MCAVLVRVVHARNGYQSNVTWERTLSLYCICITVCHLDSYVMSSACLLLYYMLKSQYGLSNKQILLYKEKSGNLPDYLQNLFPPLVASNNPYNLRNNNNFVTVARRTELYSKYFIPSSTKMWNELDNEIKCSLSLSIFTNNLKQLFKPPVVPDYFLISDRSFISVSCTNKKQMQQLKWGFI